MKKILLAAMFVIGTSLSSSAQITKQDVENMLTEVSSSMSNIKTFYIGNVKTFYTDGTWKYTYSEYGSSYDGGTNSFHVTETGILKKYTKDGKVTSVKLFPFSSISNIYISPDYVSIDMKG